MEHALSSPIVYNMPKQQRTNDTSTEKAIKQDAINALQFRQLNGFN